MMDLHQDQLGRMDYPLQFPRRSNLIAFIPSTGSVDVILFVKFTGPLNSDGKFLFGPPPTRKVFLTYKSSNIPVNPGSISH